MVDEKNSIQPILSYNIITFRFEQEIAEHPISRPVIGTNTFQMASKAIQNAVVTPDTKPAQDIRPDNRNFTPRPQVIHPRPLLQPQNLGPRVVQGTFNQVQPYMQGPIQQPVQGPPNQLPAPPMPPRMTLPHAIRPMVPQMVPTPGALPVMAPVGVPMVPVAMPMGLPGMPVAGPVAATGMPMMTPEEQKEWESTYSQPGSTETKDKKKPKEKKFVRVAGSTVWEDNSLAEWEQGKVGQFFDTSRMQFSSLERSSVDLTRGYFGWTVLSSYFYLGKVLDKVHQATGFQCGPIF